jgi:hypothetical protein
VVSINNFTISKATFEAFIGVRDDVATSQLKLFGDQLEVILIDFSKKNIWLLFTSNSI